MRAIIILCLLEFAFANYSWNGPSEGEDDASPEEPCLIDHEASCGCCMMQQKIHRMQLFFNKSLEALEKELDKTQNTLVNMRASRSAFSVALTNSDELTCVGPYREDHLIVYKHVFLNLGNGYDVNNGVFVAPRAGVHSLALTVYSDAGSPGNSLAACASLQVNDKMVAEPREKNAQDQEDSASIAVALHLKAGDKVAVNLPIGCFLCDDKSHRNTFTVFLLYATD
ncbi:cerebellin 20 [Nerophis lumbriciformis]|uniref:cerebellin 20 n=1 Tax=Nerophis lumbriciformis TaxID=546530 RepID=UPI002ADFA198|nr:complement C1q-like protein 2 [Nerophis lumbriciformis]